MTYRCVRRCRCQSLSELSNGSMNSLNGTVVSAVCGGLDSYNLTRAWRRLGLVSESAFISLMRALTWVEI